MKATTSTVIECLAKYDRGETPTDAEQQTTAAVVLHVAQLADALSRVREDVRCEILDALTKAAHGLDNADLKGSDMEQLAALGERFNRWNERRKREGR